MSAVTALGTDNTSANPYVGATITTGAQIPAGAKVIVTTNLTTVTAPIIASASINGIGMEPFMQIVRTLNEPLWGFYFDAYNAIETGAAIKATISGGGGPGGCTRAIYVTGLQDGPPDVVSSNTGATNAVSTAATPTPPSTTADYFAFAAYAYGSATAGTTTGNGYTALAEIIQATRVVKQEAAWLDFTHTVAAKTETWTDTAVSAQWTAFIALWQQGVFRVPLLDAPVVKFVEMRPNI